MLKKYTTVIAFCTFIFLFKADAQVKHSTKEIKKLMQGAWFGAEDDDAAVFSVDGDTVMYTDDFSKFKYRVAKDTFEIQTTQPHYKELIIKLNEDSLIFKEIPSGEISRYWKSN